MYETKTNDVQVLIVFRVYIKPAENTVATHAHAYKYINSNSGQ